MEKKQITVGVKEGLGAGIIAIGIILVFMPGAAQGIADSIKNSTPYGILTGAVYVFAFFTILAGLAVMLGKFDSEE
jgi:hypothetical protein